MPMETVSFITTETSDDLIVSFAVCAADDPTEVESLTLLRTPKYEGLLDDSELGVKVPFGLDVCNYQGLTPRSSGPLPASLRFAPLTQEINASVNRAKKISAWCRRLNTYSVPVVQTGEPRQSLGAAGEIRARGIDVPVMVFAEREVFQKRKRQALELGALGCYYRWESLLRAIQMALDPESETA